MNKLSESSFSVIAVDHQKSLNESEHNDTTNQGHHCHLSCQLIYIVDLKLVDLNLLKPSRIQFLSYIFLYSNPNIDLLKRPPLEV